MKISRRVIAVAAVVFIMQSAQAQVSNADTMIHKLFATLKAKDENAFLALYPTGEQFAKMMRVLMEKTMNTEEVKKAMAADPNAKNMNVDSLVNAQVAAFSSPQMAAEMQKSFRQTFEKVIEKGEKKGVNWSQATLTTYTMDTTSMAESDQEAAAMQSAGFKGLKGVIDFSSGGTAYQLAYDKIIYLPTEGGWFGAEFPQLARKGESLEPDQENPTTDSAVKPAPKKTTTAPSKTKTTPTKTKTKTATTKTKTKTKS